MNAAASAVHVSVSFVTVDDDSPALLPRNWPSAGTKSPDDSPCRYSSGSTSLTWGVLRAHGGRIAEENRIRGAVAHHQAAAVLVTNPAELVDVGGDLGLQRRGQHLPGALPHDLINQRRRLHISRQRASHVRHYCEHGCTFPARRSSAGHCLRPLRLGHREGTPLLHVPALPGGSTGFKHCSAGTILATGRSGSISALQLWPPHRAFSRVGYTGTHLRTTRLTWGIAVWVRLMNHV
jgi:hypothetical protein